MTVAVSMLGIHVFLFLRELGRVRIEGPGVNMTLNTIDFVLQGLVLVPFFVTSKGGFINLSEVDGKFWLHVLLVAAGIALFRFVVYLFVHCTFTDTNDTTNHPSKNESKSEQQEVETDEPVDEKTDNLPLNKS